MELCFLRNESRKFRFNEEQSNNLPLSGREIKGSLRCGTSLLTDNEEEVFYLEKLQVTPG